MEVAAVDELTRHFGVADPGALERFLRSDLPMPPYLRAAMADALADKRLRIVRPKGKPHSTVDVSAQRIRQLEIYKFVSGLMSDGLPQKAAVADAAQHFGISARAISTALAAGRTMKANRD